MMNNVVLASSRLVPLFGSTTVAHQTRKQIMDLLKETMDRRRNKKKKNKNNSSGSEHEEQEEEEEKEERAMIIDITATTWNFDTYAIVGGSPELIHVRFPNKEILSKYLTLVDVEVEVEVPPPQDDNGNGDATTTTTKEEEEEEEEGKGAAPIMKEVIERVEKGVLVPQQAQLSSPQKNDHQEDCSWVWVPQGATLIRTTTAHATPSQDNSNNSNNDNNDMIEFVFEPSVDKNDDRLEYWEQQVVHQKGIYNRRVKLTIECMRNMVRFYDLDRIFCLDLSWGVWEAIHIRDNDEIEIDNDNDNDDDDDDDGFPTMRLIKRNNNGEERIPFPSAAEVFLNGTNNNDDAMKSFYDCARSISKDLLATIIQNVSGYYLVGGNTYTMSLFHHMWDQQKGKITASNKHDDDDINNSNSNNNNNNSHMQLLRDLLADGQIFYMGHSAGAIMSGPNILTATFKGIDAFSIVTQPYNSPYMKLPPSESFDTFFVVKSQKNDLLTSRKRMLQKIDQYGAWRGWNVVEALSFPHYDSRPRFESFPQSAETYLCATNERGIFQQTTGSLLIGSDDDNDKNQYRKEPPSVQRIREETNARRLPCFPIANGHAIVLPCGGLQVVKTLSPEQEGMGCLHFDTYMPNVLDEDYQQYVPGRTQFTMGSFTDDHNTIAGDRSTSSKYNGARILPRLKALVLPSPRSSNGEDGLFRSHEDECESNHS
jgi:hypothetical protein